MSAYNRTRKAEKLHRLGALFLAVVQGGALALMLYMDAELPNQSLFGKACGVSLLPVIMLALLGGPFYRWCRVVGQSRWLALFPTGLMAFWAFLSIPLLATLSEATEPLWMTTHGVLFGGVLMTFILVGLNRRARRPVSWPKTGATPTTPEMTAVLSTLEECGNGSPWDEAIRTLTQGSSTIDWGKSGDAGEELAGALLALQGLFSDSKTPADSSMKDGLAVAQRALNRVRQKMGA